MAILSALAGSSMAGMEDDPILWMTKIDQLEVRVTEGPDPWVLEGYTWIGKDLNKFWVGFEAEWVDGDTEEAEVELLYSRAIAPYWDFQLGWRHDIQPEPNRDWFAIGFKGVAPYFFEMDADLYVGKSGQVNARLQGEYEIMFTQKLILTPELELNLHTRNDEAVGIGSGFSDLEFGLRLRYEIRREFAPYIGVNWNQKFGNTADFARNEGEDTNDVQFVVGIRAWF